MSISIHNDIPEKITAGDSVSWKKSLSQFSAADGWVLSYTLSITGVQITFESIASGAAHLIQLTAVVTATWTTPGEYAYSAHVKRSSDRETVDTGIVTILPNLAAETEGYNALPYCFKVRDALIAVLEMRATESQTSIAVAGRQISEMSHIEIMDALDRAEAGCNNWKRRNRVERGKSSGNQILAAFTEN